MMVSWLVLLTAGLAVPNPSFEQGSAGRPKGWRLAQGRGAWERDGRTGRFCVSVEGDGRDSARWECQVPGIEPVRLYRLSFWARTKPGSVGGCIVAGLSAERAYEEEVVVSGINRDFHVSEEWTECSFIFAAPPRLKRASIYIGQWHVKGKVYFDDVSLQPVEPSVLRRDGTALGSEEGIADGVYTFESNWGGPASNWSSALFDFTAGFNTNRWVLDEGRYVVYRHSPGFEQTSAKVRVMLWWYQRGSLAVEASRDGRKWLLAGSVKGDGEHEIALPKALFPAKVVLVRLRSEGLMQVTAYSYEARLSGSPPNVKGTTLLLAVEKPALPDLSVEPGVSFEIEAGRLSVEVGAENKADKERSLKVRASAQPEEGRPLGASATLRLGPGAKGRRSVGLRLAKWGSYKVSVSLSEGGREIWRVSTSIFVPALYATDYGARLAHSPKVEGLSLWWCGPTWKVSRERAAPTGAEREVSISAARNEFEPFQVVVRPERDLTIEGIEVTPLVGPKGARIGPENVEFLKVEYVYVRRPTDKFGCVGWWPDPLPPIKGPFKCPANVNTPIWVRVYVPKGIPAGDYRGKLVLKIEGGPEVRAPVKLHVYDFTLSDETHTRTAYGVGVVRAFHGIRTDEEEAKGFEFYMRTFARHRVSPYWPVPSIARPRWELGGPKEVVDTGPLRFVCDRFRGDFFSVVKGGERVGSIRCCLTQFERQGVGWQGKGVDWPSAEFVKSVKFIVKSPKRCVVELTAAKVSSWEANRAFEATYRFEFAPGRPWVIVKCLTIKNTDEARWRLDGFYYLVPPARGGYRAVNTKRYGAWLWPDTGLAFGGAALGEGVNFGLWNGHGDIYRPVGRWLSPGEVYKDEGPPVAIFCGPARDEAGLQALAERVREEARAFLEGRLKTEGSLSYTHRGEADVRFENLDAFDEAMQKYVEGFHFNGWNAAGLFRAGEVVRAYPGAPPELKRAYEKAYRMLERHLGEHGWLDEAYFYWFDEPREEDYPFVAEGMRLLKRLAPGVKRLLTEQPEPPLYGTVDIWVPVLSMFDPERAKERQRQGEEVWWYVCCGPRAPYPNNFVDHPAICHRIRFWAAEKYGVQGSLYWSTTYWFSRGKLRNPWDDPASYSPTGDFWGNGDGFLLYPPRRGEPPKEPVFEPPVDSIRWELIREGLEDREYFWLLRRLLEKAKERKERAIERSLQRRLDEAVREAELALRWPDRLVKSLTEWERSPERLMRARDDVARAVERLSELVRR